jgi:hypothetical protein
MIEIRREIQIMKGGKIKRKIRRDKNGNKRHFSKKEFWK